MSTTKTREIVPLLVAGNGRGARSMLPYLIKHNRTSRSTELVLACVEPSPGKGAAFAAEASLHGVRAQAVESTIEAVLGKEGLREAMVVYSAMDRPGAVRAAIDGARVRNLPAVGYFLLFFPEPTRKLFGIRFVVRPDELKVHEELTALLDTLSAVVPRGSSREVFADTGGTTAHMSEPAIRAGFAEHLTRNAPKVIAGLEPESPPLEIASADRVSTLHVVDHRDTWMMPGLLWADLLNRPDVTLRRGTSIVVAEVGPGPGLRLHQANVRMTDGGITFGTPLGEVTHRRLVAREDERQQQDASRQRAVEAATASRLAPINMTD